ncbi:hypothetical protein [Azospirillum endophyticum]
MPSGRRAGEWRDREWRQRIQGPNGQGSEARPAPSAGHQARGIGTGLRAPGFRRRPSGSKPHARQQRQQGAGAVGTTEDGTKTGNATKDISGHSFDESTTGIVAL